MTRKELENLIKTHTARLQRVIAILDENYYDFEQDEDQATYQYWIKEFNKETQILQWLRGQTADDD